MNTPLVLVMLWLLILCSGCCDEKTKVPIESKDSLYRKQLETYRWKDTDFKKPVCIVLCDFTKSMNRESSKENVSRAAEAILRKYYGASLIKFYTVNSILEEPFFETGCFTKSLVSEQPKLVKAILDHTLPYYLDSLKGLLSQMKDDSLDRSWIIYSIEKALRVFQRFDPKGQNSLALFLLSDLLESGTSSFGKIDLEDGSYRQDSLLVSVRSESALSFGSFKELTITPVVYADQVKNLGTLEAFWKAVFKKLGYAKEMVFTSELPFK